MAKRVILEQQDSFIQGRHNNYAIVEFELPIYHNKTIAPDWMGRLTEKNGYIELNKSGNIVLSRWGNRYNDESTINELCHRKVNKNLGFEKTDKDENPSIFVFDQQKIKSLFYRKANKVKVRVVIPYHPSEDELNYTNRLDGSLNVDDHLDAFLYIDELDRLRVRFVYSYETYKSEIGKGYKKYYKMVYKNYFASYYNNDLIKPNILSVYQYSK